MRFRIAPPSLDEAIEDAVSEDRGLILALPSPLLYGVEGSVLGTVASDCCNVSFSKEQAVEMLVSLSSGK